MVTRHRKRASCITHHIQLVLTIQDDQLDLCLFVPLKSRSAVSQRDEFELPYTTFILIN